MFQRRGADDEDAFDSAVLCQNLRSGDSLNRLAEPHLIANQATAGLHGKECAFALIIVERHFQQAVESGAFYAARKSFRNTLTAFGGIVQFGEISEHVVAATEIVRQADGLVEKRVERFRSFRLQRAFVVEVILCQPHQGDRAFVARSKADFALRRHIPGRFRYTMAENLGEATAPSHGLVPV